jgi:S-adenosyl methyltransferase
MAGTSPAKSALITATAAPDPRLFGASGYGAVASWPRFDPDVAHPARVYGYWLGGKDHYPADRAAAEEVIRQRPQVVVGARANRAFLARAVRYLAGQCGVRQFLDIGAGLPAPGNTLEVAQAVAADSRIVYVDNDPLVLSHARALLASTPEGFVRLHRGRCARP